MIKVLFIYTLLATLSVQQVWADGRQATPYTYQLMDGGWHNYATSKSFSLPSSGILGFDLEVTMKKGFSCMLTINFTESARQGNSKVALLGNRASIEGNASGFLNLNGSLTLSNGERLTFSPFQVYDNRAAQFKGNKKIGNSALLMNLTDVASSSQTDLGSMGIHQKHAYLVERLSRYDISSIAVGGYTFSLSSVHTAPTLRAMLGSLRKKVGEDESFVYNPPTSSASRKQVSPSYTPPVRQYTAPQPSAEITSFATEHNIKMNRRTGMNVVFSCNICNMVGRTVQASAFFYHRDGRLLMDTNRNFYTISNGQVSVNMNLTPAYQATTFTNARMFIPYGELHLPHGKYSLKVKISLFDIMTGQELAQSDFAYFFWEG